MKIYNVIILLIGLCFLYCTEASADDFKPSGYIEGGGDFQTLTSGYGAWAGEYMRGAMQTDPKNLWSFETLNQSEFGSSGQYLSIGNTHTYNPDWFSNIAVASSTSGTFLPVFRFDGSASRKWLPDRQLITTFGVTEYDARDDHQDHSAFINGVYYFKTPWILQGGVRFDDSDPGGVTSTSQFIAVTQGSNKDYFLTLRYGFGKEAYQLVDNGIALTEFHSEQVSLELRQWLSPDMGFNIKGEEYLSPYYNRSGLTIGIFKEF